MAVAIAGAEAVREAMRDYPGVLRGLGLAILVLFPSCGVATCGRACASMAPSSEGPVLVDRKIAQDGTALSLTWVPEDGPEKRLWFHIERRGYASNELPLQVTVLLPTAEIQLRSGETAAIVDERGEEALVDWRSGEILSPEPMFGRHGMYVGGPLRRSEHCNVPR
jgi:hypothetical protein